MHIAIYHDALIPPRKYGGTERIVYWLAQALASLGERVTLIAREGSSVPGVNTIACPTDPQTLWTTLVPKDADILQLWATPHHLPAQPFLVTIEGNGRVGEKFHANTVFVSRKHAERHGSKYFVHNGIDIAEFPCDEERGDYLVFLAKAAWKVKNLKGAIEVARAAGRPLKVMGSRDLPFHLNRYFTPRWKGVEYCGMLGDREKRKLLRRARGLLFPVRWHEPFGIAITEALASGCPVFGTPYGSLPEIITPDVGLLSPRAADLVRALKELNFSPQTCRERVTQGFTDIQMAKRYLELYREILANGALAQKADDLGLRGTEAPESLLPWQSI
jgi:glycosyltransferase involved in cell wall biosynthesis